jgi:hypothetical protein
MSEADQPLIPIYEEVQRNKQTWLWALVIVVALLPVGIILADVYYLAVEFPEAGDHIARNGELTLSLAIWAAFAIALVWLFSATRLETIISGDSIYYRLFPFNLRLKRLKVSDIAEYYIRKYSPILEYGGWGIRWGLKSRGRAYNIYGNLGLQIITTENKKLLIGTQRPEELKNAVDKLFEKYSRK